MEKVDRFFGCDFRVGWGIVVGEGFCVRFADAKHLVLAQILWPSAAFGHKSFVGAARVRDEWRVEGLPIAVRFFAAAGFVSLLAGYFHHWFGKGRDVSVICGFISQCWRDETDPAGRSSRV
jgi:hypothetical protein